MTVENKVWTRLGLGLALSSAVLLGACGGEQSDRAGSPLEIADTSGESGEAGHSMETLPVANRVAFMAGHVQAGLALYRAGAPDQAAPHLLHPVSEMHAAERDGIDALGFDQSLFEQVSAALDAGQPAEDVEPLLAAAQANISLMMQNAAGDPSTLIAYLMDTVVEEYQIGVTDGEITDPGEYQDAFGFVVTALEIAGSVEGEAASRVISELQTLLAMWPETGPLADSPPTSVALVVAQASRVRLALDDLE
ncbi:MAG: hypothetical protein QNI84_10890 [Henriciella sp.]|nr:hypothetical protein [Henriciella sp.]